MLCPICRKNETKVIDSREIEEHSIKRRRECLGCSRRFTTYEKPIIEMTVIKRDGSTEPFESSKILSGIIIASDKRFPEKDAENIANRIESSLLKRGSVQVKSIEIGKLVLRELRKKDKITYLRFASVYKSFDDIRLFEEELKTLQQR